MKITFGELSRKVSRYDIQESDWLTQDELQLTVPPAAEITARRIDEDSVALEGRITGTIRLECSRCGFPVEHVLAEQFEYRITTQKEEISDLPEKECSDEECYTLNLEEPVIDVAEILHEQFYLAIPAKVLCDEACRGVCQGCGGSLNSNECSCPESSPDSPFAILKKLKKE